MCLRSYQIDTFIPVPNKKPTNWRLVIPGSDVAQVEELVLSIQGVITSKDLPPVLKK